MGYIRRFFSGLNPEHLEREIVAAERTAQATREASRALTEQVRSQEAKLRPLRTEVDQLTEAMRFYPSVAECRHRLEPIRTRLKEIKQRLAVLDQQLAALMDEVMARSASSPPPSRAPTWALASSRSFDVVWWTKPLCSCHHSSTMRLA